MVDGRYPRLRPRTQQDEKSLTQPVGWIGQDMGRKMDPVRTFETPIVNFPAEIVVGVGTQQLITVPPRCVQIAFIDLVPNVYASINGGGGRRVKDGFVYNGEFNSLEIATDATGTVVIQFGCY